ncbi:MAG: hypothetical protein V1870_02440 [Candidatus Aenigmatarchaeota archaeon]
MLSWNEYVKKGSVRKIVVDKGVIKTLIEIADKRIKVISKLGISEENSSIVFTNYYDSLREICDAICLLNGYKIYSHEAIGLYLRDFLKEQAIFNKFDRFRILRNGVNYYGKTIPFEVAKQDIADIEKIIKELKTKYLKTQ